MVAAFLVSSGASGARSDVTCAMLDTVRECFAAHKRASRESTQLGLSLALKPCIQALEVCLRHGGASRMGTDGVSTTLLELVHHAVRGLPTTPFRN